MSILGAIFSKILGHPAIPAPANANAAPSPPASTGGPSPVAPTSPPPQAAPSTTAASIGNPAAAVDVGALLDGLAAKSSQKLDWKHSIVDMMKLLDLDSSLSARQALAQELHYSGDMHDSAAMNIWLHKEVMQKLAENGGKVPADLKA